MPLSTDSPFSTQGGEIVSTSTKTACDTLGNLQTFDYGSTSTTTYENLADQILQQMSRSFLLATSGILRVGVLSSILIVFMTIYI